MYSFDWSGDFRVWLSRMRDRRTWRRVAPNVWFLGITSLLTDVSSEMVASILPLYLVVTLGMSPFMFGVIDGMYPGITALVRWFGGIAGDRMKRHKELAAAGYAVSAVSRIAWLVVGANPAGIAATVTADRMGKGVRTAPRDALISLSSAREDLGQSFGVHRAMDAAGAMLGPLTAFVVLAAAPQRFDLIFVVSFGDGGDRAGGAAAVRHAIPPLMPAPRLRRDSTGGQLGVAPASAQGVDRGGLERGAGGADDQRRLHLPDPAAPGAGLRRRRSRCCMSAPTASTSCSPCRSVRCRIAWRVGRCSSRDTP